MGADARWRRAAFCALLGFLAAATGVAGARLEKGPRPPDGAAEPVYLPTANFLRPASLGYHNVLADILWFRAISYFGKHYRSDRTYPWLAHMCDLVTDLDPRAEHVYRFAGTILPWEAEQADEGIRLLEKGSRVFPDSWLLAYTLGFSYYFFKNDYDRAAFHMGRAAALPDAHPSAATLLALLYQDRHGPETTLQFLAQMEERADSEALRDVLRRHMKEARLAAELERLTAAVTAYRARVGRMPESVADLLGADLLAQAPVDPFGGVYLIDPTTGRVRSSTGHQPSQLHQSKEREKILRGESVRD